MRGKAYHLERPLPTDAMPSTFMDTVTIQPIMTINSWTLITTQPPSNHAFGSLPSVPLSPQSLLVILVHSADVLRHLHPCGPP